MVANKENKDQEAVKKETKIVPKPKTVSASSPKTPSTKNKTKVLTAEGWKRKQLKEKAAEKAKK